MASSRERKEAEEAVAVSGGSKVEKKEKKDKKDKKDKKEKKEKRRSETDGVHKSKDKSDKKDKKQKKEKLAQALDAHLQASAAASAAAEEATTTTAAAAAAELASDSDMGDDKPAPVAVAKPTAKKSKASSVPKPIVRGALVEFALPLATDKYQKKVFKIVKRAAKQQALLRGVKEVNKALRKAPAKNPSSASAANVPGVVVIAGDVNPAEVIMHLPLACEDVNVPYVFVASRGELGQAARTKRPTSVVMIKAEGRVNKKAAAAAASGETAKKAKAADSDDEDDEDSGSSYAELYQDFIKAAQKEYVKQMKGII